MQKPKDFESAREYGEVPALEPGGHILKILKVEETTSKAGDEMIIIYFDTANRDKQPDYFKQRYDTDTRDNKVWNGRVWQLIYDPQDKSKTNPAFKTFITSITKSNNGFNIIWGDKFCDCLKDKLVGGVFRREQFENDKGKLAFSVKCCGFRSVEAVEKGIKVPEDKLISNSAGGYPTQQKFTAADFYVTDDDYPF